MFEGKLPRELIRVISLKDLNVLLLAPTDVYGDGKKFVLERGQLWLVSVF